MSDSDSLSSDAASSQPNSDVGVITEMSSNEADFVDELQAVAIVSLPASTTSLSLRDSDLEFSLTADDLTTMEADEEDWTSTNFFIVDSDLDSPYFFSENSESMANGGCGTPLSGRTMRVATATESEPDAPTNNSTATKSFPLQGVSCSDDKIVSAVLESRSKTTKDNEFRSPSKADDGLFLAQSTSQMEIDDDHFTRSRTLHLLKDTVLDEADGKWMFRPEVWAASRARNPLSGKSFDHANDPMDLVTNSIQKAEEGQLLREDLVPLALKAYRSSQLLFGLDVTPMPPAKFRRISLGGTGKKIIDVQELNLASIDRISSQSLIKMDGAFRAADAAFDVVMDSFTHLLKKSNTGQQFLSLGKANEAVPMNQEFPGFQAPTRPGFSKLGARHI